MRDLSSLVSVGVTEKCPFRAELSEFAQYVYFSYINFT